MKILIIALLAILSFLAIAQDTVPSDEAADASKRILQKRRERMYPGPVIREEPVEQQEASDIETTQQQEKEEAIDDDLTLEKESEPEENLDE